ncbi:hypothetical protein H0A66_16265 [Alcaligenaceae bacterium]|nr:hypothetical protein [Alcaligenaceae bacterium]
MQFSIAIKDLPQELSQLREGAVYWLGVDHYSDVLMLFRQILLSVDASCRAIAVGPEDLSDTFSGFPDDQGPQDLRFYQMTGLPARALARLTKDLERALRPRKRLVLLMLRLDHLPADAGIAQRLLTTWAEWAEHSGCTLLLLAYGGRAVEYSLHVMSLNDVVSGAARLKSLATGYQYQVLHWRNELGATGSTELALEKTGLGFVVTQDRVVPDRPHTDQQRFLLERPVLEGAPVFMADGWQVFDERDALWEQALRSSAATLVFALQADDEVEVLAKMLHTLRKQRGPSLVLVVREMRRILRGHDEQLLLACGASMVIPAGTHLSRFFSLLDSTRGQQYARKLTTDLDSLIAGRRPEQVRGIVSADQFTHYLDAVAGRMRAGISSGILVALTPVPGLSAAQALTQVSLRRYGDVACQIKGVAYVFLFACQPGFVEVALANAFRVPFKEMFLQHRAYSSAVAVEEQSAIIKRESALASDQESKLLMAQGTEAPTGRSSESTDQSGAKPIFQPLLQSLKLEASVLCTQH